MKRKTIPILLAATLIFSSCSDKQTTPTLTTTGQDTGGITTTTVEAEQPLTTTTTTAGNITTSPPTTDENITETTTTIEENKSEETEETTSESETENSKAEVTTVPVQELTGTIQTTQNSDPTYTETESTTMYATTAVNVREGAGTSYSILGKLSTNQSVTVIGTSGDWYAIEYSGKTGYVSKSYLSKNKVTTTTTTTSTTTKPSTSGFSSSHKFGTTAYCAELLEYYGITEWLPDTGYTDEVMIITNYCRDVDKANLESLGIGVTVTKDYEGEVQKFIAGANGRKVVSIGNPDVNDFGIELGYLTHYEDYVWTEEDCFRALQELQDYADSVGYDKLYVPTQVSHYKENDKMPYGGWSDYFCTGLQPHGGAFWNDSETFESNYEWFVSKYKNSIKEYYNNPEDEWYGNTLSFVLTPLKEFNKHCADLGYSTTNPSYENGRADEETSWVFIICDQGEPDWYIYGY